MDRFRTSLYRLLQLAVASTSHLLDRHVPHKIRTAASTLLLHTTGLDLFASSDSQNSCRFIASNDGLAAVLVLVCLGVVIGAVFFAALTATVPRFLMRLARLRLRVRQYVFNCPLVRKKVDHELSKLEVDFDRKFNRTEGISCLQVPSVGISEQVVKQQLSRWASSECGSWVSGKLSGTVYHDKDRADRVAVEAYSLFSLSNPLHPSTFPSVRKMEAEIISMTAGLFHAPGAYGAVTSGGTESILMSVRAYKEWGRRTKFIVRPNIVVPVTIHAAFDKACKYFDIEIRKVPVNSNSMCAEPSLMLDAINSNTVAVACSAVAFPHGTLDPVVQIANIARSKNIGCHVDACLGSFLIPFAESVGVNLEPFDFAVDGVTSISCDPHKYGLAPKGCSVVLFSSLRLRRCMYTCVSDWTGGVYATATQAGSRSGGIIAGCWAALVVTGMSGYQSMAGRILSAANTLKETIRTIPGLRLVGEPALCVVAFTTTRESLCNIFDVMDILTAKGWELNALQNPDALHVCVTFPMVDHVSELVADLKEAMSNLLGEKKDGKSKSASGKSAAIYGMMSKVPLEIVDEVCHVYLDRSLAANSNPSK